MRIAQCTGELLFMRRNLEKLPIFWADGNFYHLEPKSPLGTLVKSTRREKNITPSIKVAKLLSNMNEFLMT